MTILKHIRTVDDQPVRPNGVLCRFEAPECLTPVQWKLKRPLFAECGVDFLTERDPERGLSESGVPDHEATGALAGCTRSRVGGVAGCRGCRRVVIQ